MTLTPYANMHPEDVAATGDVHRLMLEKMCPIIVTHRMFNFAINRYVCVHVSVHCVCECLCVCVWVCVCVCDVSRETFTSQQKRSIRRGAIYLF